MIIEFKFKRLGEKAEAKKFCSFFKLTKPLQSKKPKMTPAQ
jgi:hypothetical protein